MIVALYTNRARAEAALRELKAAGFTDDDFGMIMRETRRRSGPAHCGSFRNLGV